MNKVDEIKVEFRFYDSRKGQDITEDSDVTLDESEDVWDREKIGFELDLFINGERVKGFIDPYLLMLPHQDYREKYEGEDGSSFYVVTCGCGSAGCTGIWNGIFLERKDGNISWIIPKDSGYEEKTNLRVEGYTFNEKEYTEAFEKAFNDIKNEITKNGWNPDVIGFCGSTTFGEFLDYIKSEKNNVFSG